MIKLKCDYVDTLYILLVDKKYDMKIGNKCTLYAAAVSRRSFHKTILIFFTFTHSSNRYSIYVYLKNDKYSLFHSVFLSLSFFK